MHNKYLIKVISYSNEAYSMYSDHLGELFAVIESRHNSKFWVVVDDDSYIMNGCHIPKTDCELCKEIK